MYTHAQMKIILHCISAFQKDISALVDASDSCSGEISTLSGCLSDLRNIITADIRETLCSSICNEQ